MPHNPETLCKFFVHNFLFSLIFAVCNSTPFGHRMDVSFTMVIISSLSLSQFRPSLIFFLFLSFFVCLFVWTLSYPGKFTGWCAAKWASFWFANLTICRSTEFWCRFLASITSISTSSVHLFLGTAATTTASITTKTDFILLDDVVQAHFNFVNHFCCWVFFLLLLLLIVVALFVLFFTRFLTFHLTFLLYHCSFFFLLFFLSSYFVRRAVQMRRFTVRRLQQEWVMYFTISTCRTWRMD